MVAILHFFLWIVFCAFLLIGILIINMVIRGEAPFYALILYVVFAIIASLAIKIDHAMKPKAWLKCNFCGYLGKTIVVKKGSPTLEMLLWLLFLPGAFYANWRNKHSYDICHECGGIINSLE